MTAIKSQDLQQINSYLQMSGINTIASSYDKNGFINSVWGAVGDIDNIANGNDQQKASGMQNLLNKVLSLIEQLSGSNNETKKASQEVKKNGQNAQNLNKQVDETKAELQSEIDKITSELDGHIELIETATKNINDSTKDLETQLEALKNIQEQIKAKQEALKQSSNPTEQKQLLDDIKGLASLIPAITTSLTAMQGTLTEESDNVANAYTAVETLKGNTVELQESTEGEILSLASSAAQNIQTNTASGTTGTAQNIPTGTAATTAAEAASSNVFTASEAPQLFRVGSDQTGAGTIRISGVGVNLQTVMQGIGNLNDATEILSNFNNAIGNSLGNFDGLIGTWNDTVQPMITSIGSADYEAIGSASEELSAAADNDLATIENENENETETNDSKNNNTEVKNNLQTSMFDISKLGIELKAED